MYGGGDFCPGDRRPARQGPWDGRGGGGGAGGGGDGGEVLRKEREGKRARGPDQKAGEERKREGVKARERESGTGMGGQVPLAEQAASPRLRYYLNPLSGCPAWPGEWGD